MRIKICAADLAVGGNQDGTPPVPQGALPVARVSALGTIAGAALLTMGSLVSGNAQALTLGGMTVQSNLGEPLRAEVQVFDLTPAESASLTVQPASPTAFRSSGVDYNAALVGMQVTIERRPNGQAVLVVTGNRPVSEPFLDVLLEANWAGGRLSRNYTVLLDPPPAGQRTPPAPPLAPQIAPAPQSASTPFIAPARPAPSTLPAPRFEAPQPAARVTRPAPAPRVAAPATNASGTQLTVRPGDTAGGIANRTKAPTVSLDQMLVAMLQANPDAFVDGNVNRIRAGAVLNVPSASDAAGVPAGEAHQTVIAQSRDFNEFRRRLAAGAPAVNNAAPQRQASGSVQTQVQDRRPAATTPDRLTLSKGAANTAAAAEAERIARANQERDSAQRLAELSRNVNELNRLGTAPGSSATSTATPGPAPKPVPPPVQAPGPAPVAAPAAAAPTAPAAVVAPTAPKPAAAAPAPAPAPAESSGSWLGDSPLADPKVLGIVGLLVALVVALVSYRTIRRRRGITDDSGFARKGADSFFGGSGGQHVNTVEGGPSTLATSYSPSQLDAGGEVDPIAEADVYLAYGRDLQAEEILKEALRNHPERTALHAKLAEIYAKRRDLAAFRALAEDAHRLTGGHGADWERIQALGEELDPTHPLFSAAGTIAMVGAAAAGIAAVAPPPPAPPAPEPEPEPEDEPVEPTMDDIMLDFDPIPEEAAAPEPEPELELPPSLDLDFGAFTPGAPPTAPARAAAPAPTADDEDDFGLDFDMDGFDTPAPAAPATEPEPLPSLDLSSFSLDLDDEPAPAPAPVATPAPAPAPAPALALDDELPEVPADDALATKLALADEFNAIGDVDGARHLIEEVISEATGAVRERAERMLSSLQ